METEFNLSANNDFGITTNIQDITRKKQDPFPAHIKEALVQSCSEHNLNTAALAEDSLSDTHLGKTAFLAGILHDCGKYSEEFKKYITDSFKGIPVRKGSVIHSFAGVSYMLSKFHTKESDGYETMTSELISYAIGAHHGLFDCIGVNKDNGFIHRLERQPEYDHKAISNYTSYCLRDSSLSELFHLATEEIKDIFGKIYELVKTTKQHLRNEYSFYLGLTARLLTSSVIDADRNDTAEFMSGSARPRLIKTDKSIWDQCLANLELMTNNFPCETDIQKARHEISDNCFKFAKQPGGIYRLNIPTGGGKTLSSMRYALAHAAAHSKRRIIYTAPLISILDQNAKVIKEAIKNDDLILEHHSNIIHDREDEDISRYELLSETWDAPIIITTLVQLLNSCFSGKTSCVRRFHSLCNCVLIIDEVQSVPTNMLSLFNLTINYLSRIMGATVILCSATQPCLESIPHQLHLSDSSMISKQDYARYRQIFKRTEIIDGGSKNLDEIPVFAEEILDSTGSLLIVCNTKKEASDIYFKLKERFSNCYHLSASMCMAHRKAVLDSIYSSLKTADKTVCVSTQVIEAGVDISFGAVIRIAAGIDNIVQAAGRCNRNGENEGTANVYVIRFPEEKLGHLSDIKIAQDAANELLFSYSEDPCRFENDLSSDKSVEFFYRRMYSHIQSEQGGHFDFPIKGDTLFNLLSENSRNAAESDRATEFTFRQAFKTAGVMFEVFDHDAETVIVPYKKGKDIIAELLSERAGHDLNYLKKVLEESKEYSVSIYQWQLQKLQKTGAVRSACDGQVYILNDEYYGNHTGLMVEPAEKEENEWNIQIL